MDTKSETYEMVAKVNKARKAAEVWKWVPFERYIDTTFYMYERGDMLVMLTN